jgi:iron complex outermembrane receptor protein
MAFFGIFNRSYRCLLAVSRTSLFSIACLLSLCLSFTAQAIVTDIYPVELPQGSLHSSLIALGQQTQSSIIFPSSMDNDQDAPEVVGSFSILQILDRLIENRDIEYRIVGPQTVVVLPRCKAGWDCTAMHEDLQRSKKQYPMIEELIVRGKTLTGSRFKQIDGNSFTPTDIITSTEIRLSGAQTLSQLMRFTPEVAGNSASTAVSNGGNGNASVTLRGLPDTNTLVLINGLRSAPNAIDGGSVDLNSIPLAAVDRIEILKDSGSSIYGSDAIAGVVNVILRKSFDGVLLNTYSGISAAGDNQTNRYDILASGKVAGVELLAMASHFEQDGLFSRDRAISRSADGRSMGGADQRSSATPNARIVVGDNIVTLTEGLIAGTSPADFRTVSDEDLFDYLAHTSSLLPAERDSFFLSGSFVGLESLESTFELGYVKNTTQITFAPAPIFTAFEEIPISISADNQYNPFAEDIVDARIRLLGLGPRVQTNHSETFRANSKLMGTLRDGEWQVSLNWSENKALEQWQNLVDAEKLASGLGRRSACAGTDGCVAINFFGSPEAITDGQLDYIRANAVNLGHSTLASINIDISQVARISSLENIDFAAGLEMRRETFATEADPRVENNQLLGGEFGSSRGDRSSSELYIESLIPIIASESLVAEPVLEANISLRTTQYSDFGSEANPKLAMRYRPNNDLMLRGSISQGFRAPSLFELNQSDSISQAFLVDPCSNPESVGVLLGCDMQTDPLRVQYLTVTGGNSGLQPETSKNLSLGFIYTPPGLRNFTFGLDAYRIEIDNIIGASGQFFLDQNAADLSFSDRIIRDDNGEVVRIIANNENLGMREISGFDTDISWRVFIAKWGSLGVDLSGSHIHSYQFQSAPTTEIQELAGTFADEAAEGSGALPKWKTRLNLFWQFGRWEVALSSFRVSGLTETIKSPDDHRDSGAWSREDAQMSYHFNSGESLITFGIDNILDEAPPFLASAFNDNFDSRTYESTGRFFYARFSHHL